MTILYVQMGSIILWMSLWIMNVQGYEVHVSTGTYIRNAPAHIVIYSEYTHILFKSSMTFTQPDKWPTNPLSKECNEPEGPDQPKAQCMTYELLQNRAVRLHSVLNWVTHD